MADDSRPGPTAICYSYIPRRLSGLVGIYLVHTLKAAMVVVVLAQWVLYTVAVLFR